MLVSDNDKQVLREVAKRYREIADLPEMQIRKQQWKDLHDLKPQKPMMILSPNWLDGYMSDYELRCEDPKLRNVELKMMVSIKQFEQMGDDIVIEPYFRIGWQGKNMNVTGTDFGDIKVEMELAREGGIAHKSFFPIKTPDDVKRLSPRTFKVDREPALEMQATLEDTFGDILPVLLGNYDNFDLNIGDQPFVGNMFIGVTWDVFHLIGAEAMMLWPYDCPDVLQELLAFLVDDKKRFFQYLVDEGLLVSNTDNQFIGAMSYGYVSDLPENKTENVVLKDLWAWSESQETQMMSPDMLAEVYLPSMAELANLFGLAYYGCCERIDNKFELLTKQIHNIRCFSISGWSDVDKFTEKLGKNYVASIKPFPAYVSSPTAQWDKVKEDAKRASEAVKRNNTPAEVIFMDVYSKTVTPDRAAEWVRIWKEALEG